MIILALVALCFTLLPVGLFLKNRVLFARACRDPNYIQAAKKFAVSVLIPARNEEGSIDNAIDSILRSSHPKFELLVLDDHSEDKTASIVQAFANRDNRVKLVESAPLPEGWNGKQHGCWQLANQARHDYLLFLDADVRLTTDAVTRCVAEQLLRDAPLVSGFPLQETESFFEKLVIPLMHYVLLCYLPLEQMRKSLGIGLAAGCGQLFLAKREEYFQSGGHRAIQSSRHDGIKLPRAFRTAGLKTDIFDASDIARVRMYTNAKQVVRGLLKNATEGIANVRLIIPFTLLLVFGSILPVLTLLSLSFSRAGTIAWWLFLACAMLSMVPRLVAAKQFQQSSLGAVLHPLGVLIFVILQWTALLRSCLGLTTTWRGRK